MSIILVILKWLAITIAILLGLVLVLIALVLFVPVRYYIEGQNQDEFIYGYRFTWLLRFLMVRKKMDSEEIWLCVFGIPIKCLTDEKPQKKSKPQMEKEESTVMPIESQKKEKETSSDKENDGAKKTTESKGKKQKKSFSFEKVSSIIGFVKDKRNRSAFGTLWSEFCQLLKHISPRKVKGDFVIGTGDPSTTGLLFGGISLCPVVYTDGVNMTPDFDEAVFKACGYAKGRVSILYLLRLGLRIYKDRELRRLWNNYN